MDIELFEKVTKNWLRQLKETQDCLEFYINQVADCVYHTDVGVPGTSLTLYTDDAATTKAQLEELGFHFGTSNFGYREDLPLVYVYETIKAEE